MIPTKKEWIQALDDRHGIEFQKKISSTTVAVCGLGGLGSNIAIALARAGIGKLKLIDFDTVDITNLHRQQYKINQIGMSKTEALQYNLKEINPYIEIEIHNVYLNENNAKNVLSGADIICEAFDNAEAKANIVNFVLSEMPEKYIVAASGMAGLHTSNTIQTRRQGRRLYLCGDGISDVAAEGTLFAPRVMLCAAHQANTVLRILAGQMEV